MSDDVQRDLGRLAERTENHADRLRRIEEKLDHVVAAIDGAKGSWKALVAAGGLAAALTAGAMQLLAFFTGKH